MTRGLPEGPSTRAGFRVALRWPGQNSGPDMAKKKQATWGGRFGEGPAEVMLRFSESVSFDSRLAPFDIEVNKAHSAMLCKVGLLTPPECESIHRGLDQIAKEIAAGKFAWDPRLEDVHMNIEQALTKKVPAATRLHTARSRNDQVATDVRLFFRQACDDLISLIQEFQSALVLAAEKSQAVLIPGYTHLQRAQPVSMAHHLLAYVEMLGRDAQRFSVVRENVNVCPLGAGAIAGTTLPIDREYTAELLGFVDKRGRPQVSTNSMDAVSDRDVFFEFANACAICGTHLSRLAEDLILWSSAEFGFVELPDAFCTGSSLMPQKKNPDSMELVRGKSARIQGNLQALFTMVKGLPLTYNRDLQEDKPPVFDSFDQLATCLTVSTGAVAGMKACPKRCAEAVEDPGLLATDLADWLVLRGVPFREAHHAVGGLVAAAEKRDCTLPEVPDADAQEVHPAFKGDWRSVFDLKQAMERRTGIGMPGPAQIRKQLRRWKRSLGLGSRSK